MKPLDVLGVVAEYADGSKAVVAFGYRGGAADGKALSRYQIEMDQPVTVEAVDAERARLQASANATDTINDHYQPSVLVPAGGLTLVQ